MPRHRPHTRVTPGVTIAARTVDIVDGPPAPVPDPDALVHLQLRRFAGCPVCNLHLRSMSRRHDEITAAGVREIVVFHSTATALRPHTYDLPFAVVADSDKRLYAEFGAESSARSLLDPRAWPTIVRAVVASTWAWLSGRQPLPTVRPAGGRYGLPVDILVDPDGLVVAAHYGRYADDQWTVDDLLAEARAVPGVSRSRPAGAPVG
jgi:hypothetical protein